MTPDAEDIAKALGGRRSGAGWSAKCPAHDDHNPSLSINTGANGSPVVHCFSGCSQEAILEALRGRGLWPTHQTPAPAKAAQRPAPAPRTNVVPIRAPETPDVAPDFKYLFRREIADFWDYRDADGKLLGYVVRVDKEDEPGVKEFIKPVRYVAGEWISKAFDAPRPLYGLPELAERPDAPVLVVEGEKTAVAASQLEELSAFVVVTWPGGSSATAQVDWSPLAGRHVILWPDADDAGRKATAEIGAILTGLGSPSVRTVSLPPDLPKSWDLANSLPAGLDVEALIVGATDLRAERLAALGLITGAELYAASFPPIRWAVPNLVPEGVSLLSGPPKRGKSFIVYDIAIAKALGGVALGSIEVGEASDVLYIDNESRDRRAQARLKAILQGRDPPERIDVKYDWRLMGQGGTEDFELWLSCRPSPALIIVDILKNILPERDQKKTLYEQDYAMIRPFKDIADRHPGLAIVLVHHNNKSEASDPLARVSGSTGMTGAPDTILVLARNRGSPNGTLSVEGKDIEPREIALQFDKDTGTAWQLGPAEDFRRSEQRRAIIRALIDAGSNGMTAAEIAEEVGAKRGPTKMTLSRMTKSGEIKRLATGLYAFVES